MKTKLAVIGLAMALGAWMATANSPTVRSLEQRMADLEKIVVSQQAQIDQLTQGGTNDGLSQRVTYLEQLVTPFFDRVYVDYTGYIVYKVPVDFSADFIFCHNIYYHELTYYY